MKRNFCLLLCAVILFCTAACQEEAPKFESPVTFYYRTAVINDEIAASVIGPVTAEGAGLLEDPYALLNEYLKGTSQEGYLTTFPASTKLLTLEVTEETAYLLLNGSITRLTGVDLTIACACITLTTMELTDAKTVHIRSSSGAMDGNEEIIMDRQTLVQQDLYIPEIP